MKHSFFALPAVLRTAVILAGASQTTFSVHDDLLAFPQYDVKFSEDFLSEAQAQARIANNEQFPHDAPSNIRQYNPADSSLSGDSKKTDEVRVEYESMMLDGQRYLCSIPQVQKLEVQDDANNTLSKAEQEKELARANDRGWELLSSMQGNCVYFISGWWSYKFCYNDGVRQFHQLPPSRGIPPYPPVEDPGVEGFTLGMYKQIEKDDEKASPDAEKESALDKSEHATKKSKTSLSGELVQRGESRYLVQRLDGGTKCDLTGRDRRIEVQFHCNPQSTDRISLIKEISTCAYLMVIQTPRLCNDVAFLPPQKDEPNAITCSPVLAEDQIDDWKKDIEDLKKEVNEAQIWEAHADAAKVFHGLNTGQMVGDILVGGHALVPEGMKIEKSTIVGGKETYIDTIASSDGKVLKKEDLERFGLGNPKAVKAVEELKKELERVAQGQDWRLEVVETPNGMEYRGIIGKEEEAEKKKKDKKKGDYGDDEREGSQEEYYKEEL